MNDRNPLPPGISSIGNGRFSSIPQNASTIRRINPTQNLDQSTFAGPVFPGQRMNSAGVKTKIDVA